jgi:hypothetical protein
MGAAEYVNLPGGTGLFDPSKYAQCGIRISFRRMVDFVYPCGRYEFVPHLSILDVLMWNSPQRIKGYLDSLKTSGRGGASEDRASLSAGA